MACHCLIKQLVAGKVFYIDIISGECIFFSKINFKLIPVESFWHYKIAIYSYHLTNCNNYNNLYNMVANSQTIYRMAQMFDGAKF